MHHSASFIEVDITYVKKTKSIAVVEEPTRTTSPARGERAQIIEVMTTLVARAVSRNIEEHSSTFFFVHMSHRDTLSRD